MIIRCNRTGGVSLRTIKLKGGENTVDPAAWEKAIASVPSAWFAALTGGDSPTIEILDEAAAPPEPESTAIEYTGIPDDHDRSVDYGARDAADEIADLSTVEAVDAFVGDDERKTVIKAAAKRRAELVG